MYALARAGDSDMKPELDIDAVKIMKQMTVTVKIKRIRELSVRIWLACKLMKLAGWVANSRIKIEVNEGTHRNHPDCR